jgi:selenocysteine lyase/cysteine desulfurase
VPANGPGPAMTPTGFPLNWVPGAFPALNSGDNPVFFDNGAGARVPQVVLEAVHHHLGIPDSGAVRASLVHYNTAEEIVRFVESLRQLATN